MLVLTRKVGEAIELSVPGFGPIVVSIEDKRQSGVRVGIEAPREVRIIRRELRFQTPEPAPKETASAQPV